MYHEPQPVIPRDPFEAALMRAAVEQELDKWPAVQMHIGDGPDESGCWPIIFTRDRPFDVYTLVSQPHGYGRAWLERREDGTPVVWWAVDADDLVPYAQSNSGGSPVLADEPMTPADITPAELRRRRRALDLTQEEFALKVGVRGNTVARWERGESPISMPGKVAERLAELEAATVVP